MDRITSSKPQLFIHLKVFMSAKKTYVLPQFLTIFVIPLLIDGCSESFKTHSFENCVFNTILWLKT